MKMGTMEYEVKIKIKMSLWQIMKFRLLGFHKKDLEHQKVGEVEITSFEKEQD